MKKLGFIGKVLYFFNSLFALALLLSLLVPFIPPKSFPFIGVLSLVVSPLLLINLLFFVYWLLRLKRQMLFSLIILAICFIQFNSFYRILMTDPPPLQEKQLNVMSFNVRLFNNYNWLPAKDIPLQINSLIKKNNPEIISFQEYSNNSEIDLKDYVHKYIELKKQKPGFGQAIYSKYPIVNSGNLLFENTSNNAIFVDVVKALDTIRIYNVHLQSIQINEADVDFDQERSKRLLRRIANAFQIQQSQAEKFVEHSNNNNYKTIVTADLNNTAFSYVYRKIKGAKKDAFAERGKGLGKTFELKKIPLRIDFIFSDPAFMVNSFETHSEKLSDHYAISSVLSWN
ncbi:endonuclease/exonuclease/phosphatase family protein [uncultured Planktosalinus sp.]|uniref:endonuclease/exonuclease/phosphatase family protein n=1 Tax=uncultured Planktosalinus sp. TaxID=1810935 RepID=UPI0030DAF1EB